jgi:hypothetical protein
MRMQFGIDGEVVEADYTDPVSDPSKDTKYTEEAKRAAAGTVSPVDAKNSPQQLQLDRQVKRVESLEAKANAITGYGQDGQPLYVETAVERAKLLKVAGMERENLKGSLALAELSMGEDALDKHNADVALQQQQTEHAALEERARAIAFENQAQALAKLFAPKSSNGSGLKIK